VNKNDMNLNYIYNRTKDIIINPEIEWIKVKNEIEVKTNHVTLILFPFSIILAIGAMIGSVLFNVNNLGTGFNISSLIIGVNAFLLSFSGTYTSAYILNELIYNFTKEKDFNTSLSIIINTLIPYYLFAFLAYIIPQLSIIFTILGLYSVYIFLYAIRKLIRIHSEKIVGFLILSTMIGLIIFFVLKFVLGSIYLFITTLITSV